MSPWSHRMKKTLTVNMVGCPVGQLEIQIFRVRKRYKMEIQILPVLVIKMVTGEWKQITEKKYIVSKCIMKRMLTPVFQVQEVIGEFAKEKGCAVVRWGCQSKITQIQQFKQQKLFSHILVDGSPRSACQNGQVPARVLLLACRWLRSRCVLRWQRESE